MNNYPGGGRRIFMGRPGVYARKEISPTTEVHIPTLQAVICCLVLLIDTLLILSWGLILPVGIIYTASMIVIAILAPALVTGLLFAFRWALNKLTIFSQTLRVILCPVQILRLLVRKTVRRAQTLAENELLSSWRRCLQIDEFLSDLPTWVEKHWTTMSIVAGVTTFLVTGIAVVTCHDAWHDVCANLPHLDLPLPSASGDWSAVSLGIFLTLVGVIGFAFRPGRYPLGLTAFGGIVMAVAQWFQPVSVEIEYGWTLPLYAIWGAFCLAFIVGTGTLFLRFYVRELLEFSDYPEQRAPGLLEDILPPEEDRSGYGRKVE